MALKMADILRLDKFIPRSLRNTPLMTSLHSSESASGFWSPCTFAITMILRSIELNISGAGGFLLLEPEMMSLKKEVIFIFRS